MSIQEHSVLQLKGPEGAVEFNVDPKRRDLKIRIGKEEVTVGRTDLWALVFAISDDEQQAKMVPVRQTELVTYMGTHRIMLKKDMRKGETVVARYRMSVPQRVVEGLKGMIEQESSKTSKSGIILPASA